MAPKKKYHHKLDGRTWETQRTKTKKRAQELQSHYKKMGMKSRINPMLKDRHPNL